MSVGVVQYNGVGKAFGQKRALDDVSLGVEQGEVFGLLGPNGAGKTTLIRIAFDILRPDQGDVLLFGKPLSRASLDRCSYLPEERGVYAGSKVVDVLTYFGRLKGMTTRHARKSAYAWLERIGLSGSAHDRVRALSKGMTQKVQIAGTLIADPDFCVLDEPFSGLDPINVALVKELIDERRHRGQTTVLSTHMMNQVEALCDRVALIHNGRRVVYGRLDEVRERHSRPEVIVDFDRPFPDLDYVVWVRQKDQGRWLVALNTQSDVPRLLRDLVGRGEVGHFSPVVATMNDIFMTVVGEAPE